MPAHRVVIIGGGFAGLSAARALARAPVEVTLVDRRNFHLFQPLMYQVATGSLSPGEIAAPLRAVLAKQRNARVWLGEAAEIDPVAGSVSLRDGASLPYDSLVVCTGADTSYFGNEAWRAFAPCPKSIEEGTLIRHKIFYAFEAAERSTSAEEISAWLTFVIVGGGATGVELAGALAEIARQTLRRDFRSIRPQSSRIILIEAADRLLPGYAQDLSDKAKGLVERLGVEVLTQAKVCDIDAGSVTYTLGGEHRSLRSQTVLWGGGIAPTSFGRLLAERTACVTDRSGRLVVNQDLTMARFSNIFIAGDLAAVAGPDGKPLPGLAPVAMQEGAFAGKQIAARLKTSPAAARFRYFDKGSMAVIGRGAAVADIFGLHVWGLPAWLLWLFVHLMYLVQFQSRVLVFIQWGFLYFTFNRGSRLITGPNLPNEPASP